MSTPTIVTNRELNANDISFYITPQTNKGALDTSPEWDYVRRLSGTTKRAITYVESGEISIDQQGKQQIQDTKTYGSEIASEITQQTKDLLIASLYCEQEDNSITDTDIAATATGFTVPGHTLSAGDYFFVTGLTATDDNRAYYVDSVSGDDLVTNPAPSTLESAGNSITIASKKAQSGLSPYYYGTQERMVDLSAAGDISYRTYVDSLINSLTFEVPVSGICTSTANLVSEFPLDAETAVSGQTDATRDQSDAVSAVNNVKRFWVDGSDSNCEIKSMTLEINNNLQESRAAGCKAINYGGRSFAASGSLVTQALISDSRKWMRRYENGTRVNFAVEIEWVDGKSMIVVIEQAPITELDIPTEANSIAVNTASFSCEKSLVNGKTISIYSNF